MIPVRTGAAALGIADFSGVMTAFMQRPGRLTTVESYGVAVLPGVSFGGRFLALAPMALERFGVPEPVLWGRATVLMVAFSVVAVTVHLGTSPGRHRRFSIDTYSPALQSGT